MANSADLITLTPKDEVPSEESREGLRKVGTAPIGGVLNAADEAEFAANAEAAAGLLRGETQPLMGPRASLALSATEEDMKVLASLAMHAESIESGSPRQSIELRSNPRWSIDFKDLKSNPRHSLPVGLGIAANEPPEGDAEPAAAKANTPDQPPKCATLPQLRTMISKSPTPVVQAPPVQVVTELNVDEESAAATQGSPVCPSPLAEYRRHDPYQAPGKEDGVAVTPPQPAALTPTAMLPDDPTPDFTSGSSQNASMNQPPPGSMTPQPPEGSPSGPVSATQGRGASIISYASDLPPELGSSIAPNLDEVDAVMETSINAQTPTMGPGDKIIQIEEQGQRDSTGSDVQVTHALPPPGTLGLYQAQGMMPGPGIPKEQPKQPILKPVEILLQRQPWEKLGLSWVASGGLILQGCKERTPAAACGATACIGLQLTHVDGHAVHTARELTTRTTNKSQFVLRFAPPATDTGAKNRRRRQDELGAGVVGGMDVGPVYVDGMPECEVSAASVLTVQFKCGRRGLYSSSLPASQAQTVVGQYVLVDASKGMLDMGLVVAAAPLPLDDPQARMPQLPVERLATPTEVAQWFALGPDDDSATAFFREKAPEHGVEIQVYTADFQFDRKKLTVHYTSEIKKPDFRQLLAIGFKEFRCRIWMNNCRPLPGQPGEPLDALQPRWPLPATVNPPIAPVVPGADQAMFAAASSPFPTVSLSPNMSSGRS